MKLLGFGSEAAIYENNSFIIKRRIKKDYRIKEIDEKLRKNRSRAEFNIMRFLYESGLNVPKPIKYVESKKEIYMEKIDGKRLAESFSLEDSKSIGKMIADMHNLGVIHGDLTTANMIKKEGKVYLIDFGLSYYSLKDEDIASDIFLFKNALKSKHNEVYREAYAMCLDAYKSQIRKEFKGIDTHLKDIEERRRYNESY
ncbi:MAG: Mn2+-dependent serine/threonine protein kinase [Candidatus Parvarchaeum acidiphilum ARMAN-4]|jgi:TP53 regulating kinase-like protein|uniref:non-specific serine/threonine protein kinase n=1 Tax=Candidatus Parvarchaeum acidiphilum ARMAN-4 TaxID=662760 RepID=D2EG80_PARA4|nr:MAG: Mn2+-dependent serine/threonine protein kinase [Candidatus Parvarchaeum acidiphilum ARMAN-4]